MALQQVGWGNLKRQISGLRQKVKKHDKMTRELAVLEGLIHELLDQLNEKRRERVFRRLKLEKLAICLTHSLVLQGSTSSDFLFNRDQIKVIKLNRTWREKRRFYDGDPEYSTHSDSIITTSCDTCRNILAHSQVVDEHRRSCSISIRFEPTGIEIEGLYTAGIIDLISEQCFGMIPVAIGNILSL